MLAGLQAKSALAPSHVTVPQGEELLRRFLAGHLPAPAAGGMHDDDDDAELVRSKAVN